MLELLLPLVLAPAPQDADWPQFGGPTRTSTVPGLAGDGALTWGEEGPEVLWRTALGPGYGGAAVSDGEVFLLDRERGARDVLRVLDLATGEGRWSVGYDAPGRLQFAGSRTVPLVTQTRVVTVGGLGHVKAFDRESHEVAWELHLGEDYGGEMPIWGWSASALLAGDAVVLAVLGEDVGLVAVDLETGEERWTTPGVGTSHSTPALLELQGREQLLFLSTVEPPTSWEAPSPTLVSSFDPVDGAPLWSDEVLLTCLPIPGPVRVDESTLFVTGGYRSGSKLLRLVEADGATTVEEVFAIPRGSQIHPPVLHDGHLYLVVNENWNDERARRGEGGLLCLGLDGTERWRTGDAPFLGRGNLLLAGDRLVLQDGHSGILRVAEATSEGWRPLAEANVFGADPEEDAQMWAPMALAGGTLLVRSQEELLCLRL